ncbi:translation initiation factor IF-2 [Paramagnetospirillum magneticum]|uniref:Translation initiation factor IF-2 n=1 Tax=Paramagnetospirillum magneticum (strain ATCC 700264 / AMB-1) TaxID=342108 RepID=IF2_PARM1|nr:translation initiation factor IF-2 [Paramagnetospirillum magneticum]Q2VZV0.1 RecName: Full=Translation initiation factor IF-2 [Paramagnetospirillum magneticum AMB-1]BAE52875.1 Translation initiation factor 2 [Paramagnetospirillum magneticum AMB-1]
MSDSQDQDRKAPLKLTQPGKLELKKTVETGQVRQSFSHGRSKVVTVEVRKKRTFTSAGGAMHEIKDGVHSVAEADLAAAVAKVEAASRAASAHDLTTGEKAARAKALQDALRHEEEVRARAEEEAIRHAAEEEAARAAEEEAARLAEEEAARRAAEPQSEPEAAAPAAEPVAPTAPVAAAPAPAPATPVAPAQPKPVAAAAPAGDATAVPRARTEEEEEEEERAKKRAAAHKPAPVKRTEPRRRTGKLTITDALTDDDRSERGRSLAAVKRARERERLKHMQKGSEKVIREVIVPESITVQELANRMAVRGADVIKCLMRLGVMATINQNIDADTAELVVTEFGHNMKRVSEADVLVGLEGEADTDEVLFTRPPVVTVMGHVDHGKTSLLDALRATDVVSGEAGGITQHIGAYQVTMSSGDKITFIDTPGHEAFTAMRARGAKVTDIVVLVVAADDGIMPQTVEAIRHAKAAGVPIIVAINKIDKPGATPEKVRQELLQHELVTEELGGDVLAIEVSAKKRLNLEKLEEAILLQAEILDLKANPTRAAQGVVVEAKMEKGRGSVATVLVQKGTLKVGEVFVAGAEWGRVRALVDDHGNSIKEAGPSTPVEVLGLQGTPAAGDDFVTVEDEARAREIAGYRSRMDREAKAKLAQRGTLEQMFSAIKSGEAQELPVVIKGDVQGSIEAISSTLEKMGNENVKVRILHAAVGAINESDITLAKASNGLLIGFNVRANPQARDMARRDGVDIRYYSIIYDVTDDLKKMLSGMLAPELREKFLGYASIREVFNITKVGKVAGCMITEGTVKRGAKVRLLRDNVVIHTGDLGQLKRFKDDVKDVREGYECGMSFTNYEDIRVGDVIECFEIEEIAVTL